MPKNKGSRTRNQTLRTTRDSDGGQSYVRGSTSGQRALTAIRASNRFFVPNRTPSMARAGQRRGPTTSPRPTPRPRSR